MTLHRARKVVGFFDNSFSYRGTTRALIDYCWLATERLGWHCEILFNIDSPHNSRTFLRQCIDSDFAFPIHGVHDPFGHNGRSPLATYENLYFETVGITTSEKSFLDSFHGNLLVHQIGHEKPLVIANRLSCQSFYCSYWQSFRFSGGLAPVLPYLVDPSKYEFLPDQLSARKSFGIPANSIVLGRHGGTDTWNLPFVNEAIADVLDRRLDLWFLFLNTPAFITHPRVIYLRTLTRWEDIQSYISACDAMLHARWEGETFGLACTEFLMNRKPIITWSGSRERSHIYFADHSALMYNSKVDLTTLLLALDRTCINFYADRINHELFANCSPSNISAILEKVFE